MLILQELFRKKLLIHIQCILHLTLSVCLSDTRFAWIAPFKEFELESLSTSQSWQMANRELPNIDVEEHCLRDYTVGRKRPTLCQIMKRV